MPSLCGLCLGPVQPGARWCPHCNVSLKGTKEVDSESFSNLVIEHRRRIWRRFFKRISNALQWALVCLFAALVPFEDNPVVDFYARCFEYLLVPPQWGWTLICWIWGWFRFCGRMILNAPRWIYWYCWPAQRRRNRWSPSLFCDCREPDDLKYELSWATHRLQSHEYRYNPLLVFLSKSMLYVLPILLAAALWRTPLQHAAHALRAHWN